MGWLKRFFPTANHCCPRKPPAGSWVFVCTDEVLTDPLVSGLVWLQVMEQVSNDINKIEKKLVGKMQKWLRKPRAGSEARKWGRGLFQWPCNLLQPFGSHVSFSWSRLPSTPPRLGFAHPVLVRHWPVWASVQCQIPGCSSYVHSGPRRQVSEHSSETVQLPRVGDPSRPCDRRQEWLFFLGVKGTRHGSFWQ